MIPAGDGGGTELKVEADALHHSGAFQADQSGAAKKLAATVETATGHGNLFGLVGEMSGTADSYRQWVTYEHSSLNELGDYLQQLSERLRDSGDSYTASDEAARARVSSVNRPGMSI